MITALTMVKYTKEIFSNQAKHDLFSETTFEMIYAWGKINLNCKYLALLPKYIISTGQRGPGLVKPSNSIFGDFELPHFLWVILGCFFHIGAMKNYHRLSF